MTEAVQLAPKLDLAATAELVSTLKGLKDKDVILDLSDVKHLGALCLQVLLSAATSANAQGHSLTFINTSDRVLDQLRVMGMTPEAISRGRQ